MRSLIVGMGFGDAVYRPVLESLGPEIVTVDSYKPADFKTIADAVKEFKYFDTVNICTPNYTHESLTKEVAGYAKLVFVEKPGVVDSKTWKSLIEEFPTTRITMVKNNQYRTQMPEFEYLAKRSKDVKVIWSNNNRVPNPGSWFTNKQLAFGGVSRDLMPHAMSYYLKLADWKHGNLRRIKTDQRYSLSDLASTAYGNINPDGVYDVDDYCEFKFETDNQTWTLITDWKSNSGFDEVYIEFDGRQFELGLCPEEAYEKMIVSCFKNLNNDAFWLENFQQDMFIHEQLENL